jgi:beta-lactamase regulating signal transducer with metallopeptidase domain/Leucine-rich repeat (LRR) protein
MENHLTQITNYLLTQSWQIAVLAVVIAAMSLALKNRSAHIRYLLWLIVLAKCLAPPLVTIPLAILPQESLVEPVPILPAELPAATIERVNTAITEPPIPISAPVVKEKAVRLTVHQWLGFGWVVGVAVFAVFGVIKALRTNLWLCRQRKPLPGKLQSGIEDLFSGFDLKTLPKIWLLEGISQPFVWGLLRGSIYLPANFVKVDNAEYRKGVLGHELSHILRFDAAVNLLQVMAQAIFWFHPFVWWANKKIRGEREKCCDEMAIARLGAKVRDYSSAIVNILICEQESTRPVPSLAVAGPVKNIEERIKTMLRPGKKFYKGPSLVAVTVALLIALVTIPTALVLKARGEVQPKVQSVDKTAQLPDKPAANSEKSEQPRFAARTFNSSVAFDVFVLETFGKGSKTVGRTPSATPLEIPACWLWWVQPSAPVKDWDLLGREISQNKVPGLKLGSATDSDVSHLAGLTGLRWLDLSGTQVTDAGLEHLKGLTGLQQLYLGGTQITDVGLGHLKGLTALQLLGLGVTKVTGAGLEHLKGLSQLQELRLKSAQVTDAGLVHLKGLSGLSVLDLSNTKITDAGLEHLKGLSELQKLQLKSAQVTDAGLSHLAGLTRLQWLDLSNTKITDAGLEHLKGLTRLQTLYVSQTQITDTGMVHLKGLSELQELQLKSAQVTDAGLAHLAGLTRVQFLDLESTQITDAGLEHLEGLTGLRTLNVFDTQITDVGLGHLKGLTGLEVLALPGNLTDAGLEHLKGLTRLQYLWLLGGKITDAGVEHLKGLTGLRMLGLHSSQITDAGIEHLRGLTGLETLLLDDTQITGAGLAHLEGMTRLRQLHLSDTQLTDVGLEHLKGLITLNILNLNGTKITDAGLVYLQGLTGLGALWLDNTQITDAGIEHLKTLTGLQVLLLDGTQVTDAGVQQLKQSLPKLTIVRDPAK